MFGWALTFLIVALIAAVLGFGGIATFAPTRAWMSLTTLSRSRPLTLLCTTMRRCTFSRMTKFGPRSR